MVDGSIGVTEWLQGLWAALIGLLVWNGKRVVHDVENLREAKADKDHLEKSLNVVQQNQGALMDRLDRYHSENIKRTDEVIGTVNRALLEVLRERRDR